MCIRALVQYACGHAEVDLMNRHCECALIVGPVVERSGRWRRVCGGKDEVMKAENENGREIDGVRRDASGYESGGKGGGDVR